MRLGALAQDGKVPAVGEHPAPSAAGDLLDNAEPLQVRERGVHRGRAQPRALHEPRPGHVRVLLQEVVDAQRPARTLSVADDLISPA